mmetsp:Transcript_13068/g.14692  ORF Transcript_13068/g.14692 Transcript_13068/m.14692 type:complete len:122 (-) Transcript_13068:39-404(-)
MIQAARTAVRSGAVKRWRPAAASLSAPSSVQEAVPGFRFLSPAEVTVLEAEAEEAGLKFMNRNKRRPKKANHGARPCSSVGRKARRLCRIAHPYSKLWIPRKGHTPLSKVSVPKYGWNRAN